MWLLLVLALLLVLPAPASGKVTCRGDQPGAGMRLDGLPRHPVARRTYTIAVAMPRWDAVNQRPFLATAFCGGGPYVAVPDGRFRRSSGGAFVLELAFPRPGPWKVALMDLRGVFHEVRMGTVLAPATRWRISFGAWWLPQFSTK